MKLVLVLDRSCPGPNDLFRILGIVFTHYGTASFSELIYASWSMYFVVTHHNRQLL